MIPPAFSESTTGTAISCGNTYVVAKAANFTVAATDFPTIAEVVAYDLSLNTTVGVTATIPQNSVLALPIGMEIRFMQGVTGTTVVTAGSGVTLLGRSATVAASTGVIATQVSLNKWFIQ